MIKPQEYQNDIKFVGTIDLGLQGFLSRENTTGIDFAILASCDHIILSHGTFGMWAAFLGMISQKMSLIIIRFGHKNFNAKFFLQNLIFSTKKVQQSLILVHIFN